MAHDADRATPDETHVSPDGVLTLLVYGGDDPWLRFDGFDWHAHGDAVAMAEDIISGRVMLDLRWKGAALEDARALMGVDDFADYLARAEKYKLPDERIELRTWNGGSA